MRIASCMIVKNEEENISNVIEQLLEFSSNIYIVDTGSTDRTAEIVSGYADKNVHLDYFEWNHNFSDARNHSLSLVKDADYIFWCDGDEKLSDEFIRRLKVFASEEYSDDLPDAYAYGMITFSAFDNNCHTTVYDRMGIFKANKGITFANPVHEVISGENLRYDRTRFAGFMLSNYYDKTGDECYRNFKIFGNIQNTRQLTCRESYYSGRELNDLGYPVGAMLFAIEAIMHEDWYTEVIDALYDYAYFYRRYESCRKLNCIKIADVTKYMFDHGMLNRCVLMNFSDALTQAGEYELAAKCAEYAYNMADQGIPQIITEYEYDEIHCMFNLVVAHDRLCHYRTANEWNEKILSIEPNNKIALGNREYFKNIFNEHEDRR